MSSKASNPVSLSISLLFALMYKDEPASTSLEFLHFNIHSEIIFAGTGWSASVVSHPLQILNLTQIILAVLDAAMSVRSEQSVPFVRGDTFFHILWNEKEGKGRVEGEKRERKKRRERSEETG